MLSLDWACACIMSWLAAAEAQRLLRLLLNVIGWAHDSRIAESRVRCVLWLVSALQLQPCTVGMPSPWNGPLPATSNKVFGTTPDPPLLHPDLGSCRAP